MARSQTTPPSSGSDPPTALIWSTILLLFALTGTITFAGVNLDAGVFFLALALVVHLVVSVRCRVWRGNNTRLVFWQRVSAAACLATAALWFGIAANQVRLTNLPAETQQRLAREYYFRRNEPAWPFAVLTGFPFREMLTFRPHERPKPVQPPKQPHFIGTLHGGPNYLRPHVLHIFWMNSGLLLLAAAVATTFLRSKWLAKTHAAAVPLAALGTGIQLWMLIDPYALLP